tara:strand:+ start:774 stop:1025 length:252 start_codon:yes stop_codon:yes gene_type:complete
MTDVISALKQNIKELKDEVWAKYQEDSFGYAEWFDHLDSVNNVDDIIRTISKWDFDDTDNAVFYYTKITTLENVLYAMEEEEE